MKVLLLTIAIVVASYSHLSAQKARTVTDYFMLFPGERFSTGYDGKKLRSKAEIAKFRRSMIKVEDTDNGYLRIEGTWEGWDEFAVFKRPNGSHLIAHTSVGCGPACSGSIAFYEYKAGRFTDVTSKVMDLPTDEFIERAVKHKKISADDDDVSWYFELPRKGGGVKVLCSMCGSNGEESMIVNYKWNGKVFEVS